MTLYQAVGAPDVAAFNVVPRRQGGMDPMKGRRLDFPDPVQWCSPAGDSLPQAPAENGAAKVTPLKCLPRRDSAPPAAWIPNDSQGRTLVPTGDLYPLRLLHPQAPRSTLSQ